MWHSVTPYHNRVNISLVLKYLIVYIFVENALTQVWLSCDYVKITQELKVWKTSCNKAKAIFFNKKRFAHEQIMETCIMLGWQMAIYDLASWGDQEPTEPKHTNSDTSHSMMQWHE